MSRLEGLQEVRHLDALSSTIASRNTLMARNAREVCNYFAHLYLHNGQSKN